MPFRDIIGNDRIRALLSRACERGTLPPSLLMAGRAGVGKRRVAMALAQALNCLRPHEGPLDACGECAACRRIARGSHPDVIVVEPGDTGAIKIDQIREVIDRASYRPFEARRRVVIVDDADAMMAPAQNALLKTLEEPPPASVFVLVSAMPDMLLPTVRSRCPRLRFAPLNASEVAAVLMRDHEYTETDARAAAAEADGSVGLALAAQSSDLSNARRSAQHVLTHVARIGDLQRRLDIVKELAAATGSPAGDRQLLSLKLRALSSLVRDLGVLATHADPGVLANTDLQDELARLAPSYDSRRTMRAFQAIDTALGALERNASPKIVANWLVLEL